MRLRPPRLADHAAFVAAQQALAADDFPFAFDFDPAAPFDRYLAAIEGYRHGQGLAEDRVPATFLVADVDGQVVGRSSIRHELNDFLVVEGGHIGYGVLPEHRRRGYATEILRQSLVIARAVGVDRVLVTCDEGNVGSATVIERCGGVLENVIDATDDGIPKRRYWIS